MSLPGDGDDYVDSPVRTYVRTAGRTRPNHPLRPDSLLVGIASAMPAQLGRDARDVLACCRGLTSLAELAAHLRLPSSVVAITVSDMIDAGYIGLRPGRSGGRRPDRETLEKVLHALDRL